MPVTGIFQPDPWWSALAAGLVLLVPGWVLLRTLPAHPRRKRPGGLALVADAVALSIAISALLALWFFLLGLRLNGWMLTGLYAAGLLAGLVQVLRSGWPRITPVRLLRAVLAVLLVLALVAWRFYQARNLALPAWVDSVHHVLIVRAIGEYGGVPPDLSPYLSIPFYYHYGFHLVAAVFAFWARLSPEQSVLWLGQVLNALVALSVYRVGSAFFSDEQDLGWLGGSAPRALLAALLVGFAFQMPAYYISWGRYTLLTGLLVLGPAMAAARELYVDPTDRPAAIRLVLLMAGLCVVHYLALVLMLLFLLVLGLAGFLPRSFKRPAAMRAQPGIWRALPWGLVAAALLGLLLAAPWLWRVVSYNLIMVSASARFSLPADVLTDPASLVKGFDYLISRLGPRHSHVLFILGAVGLVFALRRPPLRVLAAWAMLLIILDLPWGVTLGPFRPDHYAIVQFFPASLFLADLLFSAGAALRQVLRGPAGQWAASAILVLAAAGLLAWGLRETRSVVNNTTNFTNTSDVAALEWVKANTPPTARFFINTVLWQGPSYRGVDGGYWLVPYTGRASLLPPSLYSVGAPETVQQINDWALRAGQLEGCTPEFWSLMRDARLTHLYLRAGSGSLQPDHLADCPRLRVVYQRGGVSIYEVPGP